MSDRHEKALDVIRQARELIDTDELDDDLRDDFNFDMHADLKRRVERLEATQQTDPQVEAGERVLAKAQEALQRDFTPDGIMDRAQRALRKGQSYRN